MATREQNERKFDDWLEMPDGGRRYILAVQGRQGWSARYVKEVDSGEETIRFWQEVYDAEGRLVEIHHKYPVDGGHRRVPGGMQP